MIFQVGRVPGARRVHWLVTGSVKCTTDAVVVSARSNKSKILRVGVLSKEKRFKFNLVLKTVQEWLFITQFTCMIGSFMWSRYSFRQCGSAYSGDGLGQNSSVSAGRADSGPIILKGDFLRASCNDTVFFRRIVCPNSPLDFKYQVDPIGLLLQWISQRDYDSMQTARTV